VLCDTALYHALQSYDNALLGGIGFIQGSDTVTHKEWHNYTETIDIGHNFPGMRGIGVIVPVNKTQEPAFVAEMHKEGIEHFSLHPVLKDRPNYIVKFAEPERYNKAGLGLNIAFEDRRLAAAEQSRDTGKPIVTKNLILSQDNEKTPGFLLMHPMYYQDKPLQDVSDRRAALRGWVYASFVARDFLHDLSKSQGVLINMRVYQDSENPHNLIFNSDTVSQGISDSVYTQRKILNVMQQKWVVVWESTPLYEHKQHTDAPMLILISGLVFSGLLAIFLIVLFVRRGNIYWLDEDKKFALPLVIFIITAILSFYFYNTLKFRELSFVKGTIEDESRSIGKIISVQSSQKLLSLKRMAQRWDADNGTPYNLWRQDAENYTQQLSGLRAVEWVDATYHIRWVIPHKGNEKALGLNILLDKEKQEAIKAISVSNALTTTPPLDLIQGYNAFISYAPVTKNGKFGGLIAGVFSTKDFLDDAIGEASFEKYAVSVEYEGKEFYRNDTSDEPLKEGWSIKRLVRLYDRNWTVIITPTQKFVESRLTSLPLIVLLAGLLIALLLALTIRYILVSRIKSKYLLTSEETFRSALEFAAVGMALISLRGQWIKVNQALCDLLGYSKFEMLSTDFQTLTYPEDLERSLDHVSKLIAGEISSYQIEKRYLHKDGRIVWVLLSVSLVRDGNNNPNYLIAQIMDITERKEVERMKSEFVSIVSHELRTPLTSIRGSLGLIVGTMAKDLPDKVNRLIQIAHENSERLILLINDILDIDKIASGQMRFDVKRENLGKLLAQSVEANQAYGEKFFVRMSLHAVKEDIDVRVDAARFIQVMSNLLSNAIKFSPERGVVDISVKVLKERVRINVTDHGPGIPDEFRSRIFSKFSQADSSLTRSKGGTGLGLHISKQILEHMNGTIGFDTQTSKGTTFWIELPLELSDDPESIILSGNVLRKREHQPGDMPMILHVEDDVNLSWFIGSALQDKALVTTARTLAEAKKTLQEQSFDLLLLDIVLPDGLGIVLLDYLPETGQAVPVLILSASETPENISHKVAASMVKSRMSEEKIIETILSFIPQDKREV
jgi:PAS domain S-box-containing protein